jgi:hypothetical protein
VVCCVWYSIVLCQLSISECIVLYCMSVLVVCRELFICFIVCLFVDS